MIFKNPQNDFGKGRLKDIMRNKTMRLTEAHQGQQGMVASVTLVNRDAPNAEGPR